MGENMEKTLYDADPEGCKNGPCPKFVVDEQTQIVSLVDKQGNRASMSVEHYNRFVRAARSGAMRELRILRRK